MSLSRKVSSFKFSVSSGERVEFHTENSKLQTENPESSGEGGFTLIELLISLTIVALIFAAVLGAIQIGAKSWESGEARAEENQRNRTLIDALARDLTMIYPLRVKEQDKDVVVFHGKSNSIEFATLPQLYGAEPFNHMIRTVNYTLESNRGLVATTSYPLADSASVLSEGRTRPVDERVSQVRFRYLVPEGRPEDNLPPTWRDFWDPSLDETLQPPARRVPVSPGQRSLKGSDRLPLAVELTLTIRQTKVQGARELILPPLVFPVQVGRAL